MVILCSFGVFPCEGVDQRLQIPPEHVGIPLGEPVLQLFYGQIEIQDRTLEMSNCDCFTLSSTSLGYNKNIALLKSLVSGKTHSSP